MVFGEVGDNVARAVLISVSMIIAGMGGWVGGGGSVLQMERVSVLLVMFVRVKESQLRDRSEGRRQSERDVFVYRLMSISKKVFGEVHFVTGMCGPPQHFLSSLFKSKFQVFLPLSFTLYFCHIVSRNCHCEQTLSNCGHSLAQGC